MADPFKEAIGRAMEPEPKEESREAAPGAGGEVHSVHHFSGGGKHHVVKHHSGGVEHSEHAEGSGGETCPLCGGTGEVEQGEK